ncbi:MAG: hypothetical protein K9J06_04200 [Flavobacteriales bacterium]|nr:hypothetical protein [Flavobacteriales bacterium]
MLLRAILISLLTLSGGTLMVLAQPAEQASSGLYGNWYVVKVDYSPKFKEELRQELGTEFGSVDRTFSETTLEKNWNWVQRNISNRRHRLRLVEKPEGCLSQKPGSTELWPLLVTYITGCNRCISCGDIRNASLVLDGFIVCTARGCSVENSVFSDLDKQLPMRIRNDTLILGTLDTRCLYYLVR